MVVLFDESSFQNLYFNMLDNIVKHLRRNVKSKVMDLWVVKACGGGSGGGD